MSSKDFSQIDVSQHPDLQRLIRRMMKNENLYVHDRHDRRGNTALHLAAEYDRLDLAEALMDAGLNAHALNGFYETPLHVVKSPEMADLLLANEAEIHATERSRLTPFLTAVRADHVDVASFLLDRGAKLDDETGSGSNAFYFARSAAMATLLVRHGLDVNKAGWCGWTPLHCATNSGNPDVVEILIDAGAEIHSRDDSGQTPLHKAMTAHRVEAGKALLRRGANPDARDDFGRTPLQLAAHYGAGIEVMQMFIDAKADVNAKDNGGNTALHWLNTRDECGRLPKNALADFLVKNGADVFARNKDGEMPAHPRVEKLRIEKQRKHLQKHLAQVPTPSQVNASVGQGNNEVIPRKTRGRL